MLNWVIDFSLRNRAVVLIAMLVVIVAGGWSLQYLDIDAFPDTTPVMVQINTTAPSLAPEEVERQITFPIEQVIRRLARLGEAPVDFQVRTVSSRRCVRRQHGHLFR